MNIFILDNDIDTCARYHVDKHCVKMILETTQLLNNAMITGDSNYTPVYRQTHKNHPCSLWAYESINNFNWLVKLGLSLCEEYTYRYGKIHKCQSLLENFLQASDKLSLPKIGMTPFKLCMPDKYKVKDPVESYRNYYRGDKAYIAKWSKREQPEWWNANI